MSAPTRYPSGIADRSIKHPMGNLPFPDPTKFHVFFDDFNSFVTAASGVTGWVKTEVNAGTDPVVQDAAGGVILFTLDNANNDNQHYAWGTGSTAHEIFKLVGGKRAWLRTKFYTEDADTDIPWIGLATKQGDPWGTAPTEQFNFKTLRTDPDALVFACGVSATNLQTVALGNLEDNTFVICTAYYDGKNTVHVWRETEAGVITHTGQITVTASAQGDLLPAAELGVAFGMEATDTGTDNMGVDYILAVVER